MAAAASASGRNGDAARALAATVLQSDGAKAVALEHQPLLERRILFHPARKLSSVSPSLPPGVEPLNNPAADQSTGTGKRSWEDMANVTGFKPREHEEDDIVLEWGAPVKIGAGLSNLGNTCFLNSVLQCLTYTPPLSKFLESGQHKATCRNSGFCALCALEGHVKNALRSWGKVVSPNFLVKNLRCISRGFQPWRQEDAHEYLRYLLEALHKACLRNKTPGNTAEQEKSLMYKIFGGQLRSQVKCTNCMHCSDTVDPFLDLSLEITHADSLPKALARFTATEVLDGENKYQCGKCKMKVRALKRFTIESAPNILTVQFKRFSSYGHHGRKIDKQVHFGRTLDISPFMTNGKKGAAYDLYGVLVHSGGSTHSGHYYCFVRTAADMWHVLDDTRVKQLSEQTVLGQRAYILFYMRKTDRKKQESSAVPSSVPSTSVSASRVVSPALIRTDVLPAALNTPVEAVSLPKPLDAEGGASPSSDSADKLKEPADGVKVQRTADEAESDEETAEVQTPNDEAETVDQKIEPELEPEVEPAVETEVEDRGPSPAVEMEPSGGGPISAFVDVAASVSAHGSDARQQRLEVDIDKPTATESAVCDLNTTSEASSPSSNKRKMEASSRERVSDKAESRNGFKHKTTDSPRKCDRKYMKLLRAMPRSRRLLFEKALELNQGDNAKRRKLNDESRRDAKMNGTRPSDLNNSRSVDMNVLKTSDSSRNGAKMNGGNTSSSTRNATTKAVGRCTEGATGEQAARNELFGDGVARWDGVEANGIDEFLRAEHKAPSVRREEWDEEYDRGKVKKVRRGAGGGRLTPYRSGSKDRNPFQVLAGGENH